MLSVGYGALKENLNGNYNSGYGRGALIENTSGNGNTAYGWNALSVNKTGNYNTAVGAKADLGADNLTNATAIGNGAIVTASNKIRLGNTSVTVIEGEVAFSNSSDKRLKKDITNTKYGLQTILELVPVTASGTAGFKSWAIKPT